MCEKVVCHAKNLSILSLLDYFFLLFLRTILETSLSVVWRVHVLISRRESECGCFFLLET